MLKIIKLKKRYINDMRMLCEKEYIFNKLNRNFFDLYDSTNILNKFLLRKKVFILILNKKCIGYIWFDLEGRKRIYINSLYIDKSAYDQWNGLEFYHKCFRNSNLYYLCCKNDLNSEILEKIGFQEEKGSLELMKNIDREENLIILPNITFETYVIGSHENIRCNLQNTIFYDHNRLPLTIEDIEYDVKQGYFWGQGSIFIKYKEEYIGYGQIIIDDVIPTIVNFGILDKYRNRGYGKLLLQHLVNILYNSHHSTIRIRVDYDNVIALNLYTKLGFKIENRISHLIKKC